MDIHATTAFWREFSTSDHIHIVANLIEVSREYWQPAIVLKKSIGSRPYLTAIDLKKALSKLKQDQTIGYT
ncbi:unnamed protein product [Heligmosomoides polygyrus]|uniref:Transposase n=1 Tax=Heligmosomoides polygyrus TaxID=6339 RepID=A0A183F710_HELPZ|nr:unnamed protein product [Heligmosomoides polygyrus]